MMCVSIFNIFFTLLPIIIVDIYGLIVLSWGTQFYIILIETLILCLLILLLTILEFCCVRSLSKKYEELEQNSISSEKLDFEDDDLDKKMRKDALKGIIKAMDHNPTMFDENHVEDRIMNNT
jgi:hypothetical protein